MSTAKAEDILPMRRDGVQAMLDETAWLRTENVRLRAILLRECCHCGPSNPDPAAHAEWCMYRQSLERCARQDTAPDGDAAGQQRK